MFFKYIDKYNIELAPTPLYIDNQQIITDDEALYNQEGYYRLVYTEYPTDGKEYKPFYIKANQYHNYHIQGWEIVDKPLSIYLDEIMEEK